MKALIIDDEAKAREVLCLLLGFHVPEFKEIREASSGAHATEILSAFKPDIVFLDIKMPVQDGFSWLQSLPERKFNVIFTTAYDQYAIKAIRYSAFDYLLKPIDTEDLINTIKRFISKLSLHENAYANLFYNAAQGHSRDFQLTISTTEATHYLNPDKIIRCEADGNYTHFHMEGGEKILASRPIGHFSNLLPEEQFIRCHKSHLVNKLFVKSIKENNLKLKNDMQIEISRRRRPAVKKAMENS